MPRMSKKRKYELSFYLNDRGRVTYNELCRKCQHGCKQSFRAVVIDCPRYLSNEEEKGGTHRMNFEFMTIGHTAAAMYAISQSVDGFSS